MKSLIHRLLMFRDCRYNYYEMRGRGPEVTARRRGVGRWRGKRLDDRRCKTAWQITHKPARSLVRRGLMPAPVQGRALSPPAPRLLCTGNRATAIRTRNGNAIALAADMSLRCTEAPKGGITGRRHFRVRFVALPFFQRRLSTSADMVLSAANSETPFGNKKSRV